jgi:sugar phosphate isomerase/epimerase
MKFALCNEMFEKQPMAQIASVAARLGYHGIEIAPFTLGPSATEITVGKREETRKAIEDHGLEVVGLHWLFAGPTGLHMTTPDQATWQRTRDYLAALLDLCSDLGGKILVLGSPKQRSVLGVEGVPPSNRGQDVRDTPAYKGAWKRAVDLLSSVVEQAGKLGLTICFEPLSPVETNFVNTVEEGMKLVREVNHPSFKIHLDVKAMCSEGKPVPAIIRSVKVEDVGHFHVNDPNLYGPGMGEVDYAPIAKAVHDLGYDKWLSVEPFKYDPDPETVAKKSMECLRRFWP